MINKFYNNFDKETLEERRSDYRTPFQQDRDRIIHTYAFRRLQAKTQVFLPGEYDFYRTRLTHSIEVAQIGRSICNYLRTKAPLKDTADAFIDPELVEAACLVHDIGHPPFGHAGERELNMLMRDYGGFEGNAQTLRIITEKFYSGGGKHTGMKPTRALVDAVLKYKTLHRKFNNPKNHFIYDDQEVYLKFVLKNKRLPEYSAEKLNNFRSIECQIMNWADDTAYSLSDLLDGVQVGLITPEGIEKWKADKQLSLEDETSIEKLVEAIRKGDMTRYISGRIGQYVKACRLVKSDNPMSDLTNRYRFDLKKTPEVIRESKLYKDVSTDLVFKSPQLQQLEHKGKYMLRRIFETFKEQYLDQEDSKEVLLPSDIKTEIQQESDDKIRARLICDYIAGMTDGFAVRTYRRLFDPDFGSILDIV